MADEQEYAATVEVAGAWTDESNAIGIRDDSCMSTITKNAVSGEFSFNFTDVSGTIDGIRVLIHYSVNDTNDFAQVELYDSTSTWRGPGAFTSPYAAHTCADGTTRDVGAVDYLWGGTFTAAHIKSSNFRVRITAKASGGSGALWHVDEISVRVYYTEAPATRMMVID